MFQLNEPKFNELKKPWGSCFHGLNQGMAYHPLGSVKRGTHPPLKMPKGNDLSPFSTPIRRLREWASSLGMPKRMTILPWAHPRKWPSSLGMPKGMTILNGAHPREWGSFLGHAQIKEHSHLIRPWEWAFSLKHA